ncbi:MAG: CgeB family protein [Gemmatimonadota bacterium]
MVIFTHSVISDWSHGNAHFQRGLMRALGERGHEVVACERWRSWSVEHLFEEAGAGPIVEFARRFADLEVRTYGDWDTILEEVDELTRGADLVIVHEFNEPELVGAVSRVRRRRDDFVALFHDTHHRAVTVPHQIERLNLRGFDGVLAYGESLAEVYRDGFGFERVWTFHEAADTTVFRPLVREKTDDVVWIGNWGDDERKRETRAYVVESARRLPELRFAIHGVRYPKAARAEIREAGIDFRGWIANLHVPEAYARARMTLHIPRRPYREELPGIPTIRPFEALACGIPLLCTPWEDREGLFREGRDYVGVRSPREMREWMRRLAVDEDARLRLAENGLGTIRARHTCAHRAERLEAIHDEVAAVAR